MFRQFIIWESHNNGMWLIITTVIIKSKATGQQIPCTGMSDRKTPACCDGTESSLWFSVLEDLLVLCVKLATLGR